MSIWRQFHTLVVVTSNFAVYTWNGQFILFLILLIPCATPIVHTTTLFVVLRFTQTIGMKPKLDI